VTICVVFFGADAHAQTKIVVGGRPNTEPVAAMVAVMEGSFKRHNLDATYTLITINPSIPPALLSNSLQIGIPTPTTFIQAVHGRRRKIVARKDANIKGAKGLVGKKFGAPGLNAVLHVMTRYWLAELG
jgi:NitT/TauT family transport system substrate-binding protein